MSITKGLGGGDTNSESRLFCHASAAEREGGGSTLRSLPEPAAGQVLEGPCTQQRGRGDRWRPALLRPGAGRPGAASGPQRSGETQNPAGTSATGRGDGLRKLLGVPKQHKRGSQGLLAPGTETLREAPSGRHSEVTSHPPPARQRSAEGLEGQGEDGGGAGGRPQTARGSPTRGGRGCRAARGRQGARCSSSRSAAPAGG